MMNIFIFLLFGVVNYFYRGRVSVKRITAVSLLGILCVFLIAGCNNTKTVMPQKNKAGTVSVSVPAATAFIAPVQEAVAQIDEPPIRFDSEGGEGGVSTNSKSAAGVVEIKEKMFIAQTNDIYLNAEDYLGKTIKLQGLFKKEQYEGSDTAYCFVIRYGPGCCGNDGNAGFEVAWEPKVPLDERWTLKAPYPAPDDWVEATGALKTYEEDGFPYLYIALTSLTVLDERGMEFVTQ
jgi:uncharacterized membrane protein YcgQ (UPF0703/DUF1980 family)